MPVLDAITRLRFCRSNIMAATTSHIYIAQWTTVVVQPVTFPRQDGLARTSYGLQSCEVRVEEKEDNVE